MVIYETESGYSGIVGLPAGVRHLHDGVGGTHGAGGAQRVENRRGDGIRGGLDDFPAEHHDDGEVAGGLFHPADIREAHSRSGD